MSFKSELLQAVSDWRLLKHPFYQAWEHGEVSRETLKTYARQYYHHVEAFPRYLSATHSGCQDAAARQELLKNLIDEELGTQNHPELWMQFAEGLGNDRAAVKTEKLRPETTDLIDTFLEISSSSYAEGLCALFMYEEQTPEIATTKMDGLRKHYGVSDTKTLGYFDLHESMDIEHSAATGELVDRLPASQHAQAIQSTRRAAQALWRFLDGMQELNT
ncbi:MAG: CADD family putative folate metabolism protein [Deltaproteobacteria bacterium]|nr:CADD family putative folate metabolism protein [Deltaproteobacteria bacterium]